MLPARRSSRHLFSSLCVACAGLLGGGCSFVFVDGPPAQHAKMPYFDCTSGNALPVIDLVLAASEGIAGATALAGHDAGAGAVGLGSEAVVQLAAAGAFAASGLTGLGRTSSCREAKDQLLQRAARNPAGYGAAGFAPMSPPPGYGAPASPPQPYDPWSPPPAAPPDTPPPRAPTP